MQKTKKGNRIKKLEIKGSGNITTYYVSDNFIRVKNASGSYDEVYFYDGNTLVGKNASNVLTFYHPDHLGSTNAISDKWSQVIEFTTYDPFGQVISGGSDPKHLYNSNPLDAATNLLYYGARYYNPRGPWFTQPDSVIQDIYNSQDLNHYAYVRNNPYKYVDPDGQNPVLVAAGIIIGANALYYGATEGYAEYKSQVNAGTTINWAKVEAKTQSGLVRGATFGTLSSVVLVAGYYLGGPSAALAGSEYIGLISEEYFEVEIDQAIKRKEEEYRSKQEGINQNLGENKNLENQQSKSSSSQTQQNNKLSPSRSGGSRFGNSYIVRRADGSVIVRTNIAGGHVDTPLIGANQNTKEEKKNGQV